MGARAPAGRLRLFQPQHSRQQRRGLFFLSWADQPDAAGLPGFEFANAMVPGLPSQSTGGLAAPRSGLQHGLESPGKPGGNRQAVGGGVQHSKRGAVAELLDMSSLADGMSDHHIDDSMRRHDARENDLHHDEQPEDLELRERPLDLASLRAKLQTQSGKQYWRTLEELAGDPHFEELLHREFPRQASEWDESVDRRDFLKLMAASLAFAGLAGCKANVQTSIVPYVKQPDGMVLGKPLFFATAMPFGADAIGLLVESHEGRPTKIEGNPDHPASLGATDPIAQASILNLYDPDRARTPSYVGEIRTWSAFLDAAQAMAAEIKSVNGAGLRILSGTIASPSVAEQLQYVLKLYPQAKWHQWEPAGSDGARRSDFVAGLRFSRQRPRPRPLHEGVLQAAQAGSICLDRSRRRRDEPALRRRAHAFGDRLQRRSSLAVALF